MFVTEPFYSPRPWGYELWTLSTHRSGQSLALPEKENLLSYLGAPLPILIKIIKADQPLSVQVHPNDEYAKIHENDKGKTECWYILEAEENAHLIAGIQPGLNREKMAKILADGELESVLKTIPVKAGEMVFIPAGTVHAIMGGLKLFEIQESSDSTYRMYDWGRDREMHIEKSLDVIDYECKAGAGKIENFTVLNTPFFNVEKLEVSEQPRTFEADHDFNTVNVCHGAGTITTNEQVMDVHADQTVYIPKGMTYTLQGNMEVLRTWQNPKE